MIDDIQKKRIRKLEERDRDKQAAIESAFEHLEPFARSGAVPVDELEDLAEEWHNAQFHKQREDRHESHEVDGLATAAEELRNLIEKYD